MNAVIVWQLRVALVLGFVFFLTPIALAQNTHSINLEQNNSQYLSLSDALQTGLDLSGNFTVEAWIKLETLPTSLGYSPSIISKEGVDSGWNLRISADNDKLDWVEDGQVQYTAGTVFTNGVWHHVAVVYNGTNISMYVDGVSELDTPYGGHTTNDLDVEIGRSTTYTSRFFDGLIDDVRVWNVARTAQEIADGMESELNGNEAGLVSYWKLNNDLTDSTTSGNNLTNNNNATFSSDTHEPEFSIDLVNRKNTDESVVSSTVLQDDNQLKVSLAADETYIIDGVIFAESASAIPDIILAFTAQSGSDIKIGYTTADDNEVLEASGMASSRIALRANRPTAIFLKGTVTTDNAGDLQLRWAQGRENANATVVGAGSYLRAQSI